MYITELFEAQDPSSVLVVYPGRFQPWHKGHKMVYDYLTKIYGRDNVFIATSNKVDPPRSPFTFSEKQQFMHLTGISADRIVETRDPYRALEIVQKYNPKTTRLVLAVSEKDMAEDPRFKFGYKKDGSPTYFQQMPKNVNDMQPFEMHGYIMTVPTFNFTVLGEPMKSATEVRAQFAQADEATQQAIVKDLFGAYDRHVHDIMKHKLSQAITESIAVGTKLDLTKNYGNFETLIGVVKDVTPSGKLKIQIAQAEPVPGKKGAVRVGDVVTVAANYVKKTVAENFADGRNPEDKGDAKRHGVPTKASVSTLRKVAKQGGRKGQLAHWMANMKSGRAKAKNESVTGSNQQNKKFVLYLNGEPVAKFDTEQEARQQSRYITDPNTQIELKHEICTLTPVQLKENLKTWAQLDQGVAEAATDDPRFQKMMGNIQKSTPNPVNGYVAVSYASERPSKKIKGVTYNGKPMPGTVDPEEFMGSKIKFTPDQIEEKLMKIGQKYGWDSIDPGHGQGYDELYFDTSAEYTSATQRQLAVNIVKTVNEIDKFFNEINRSLQATGLPGYKVNVWQGMGENGNINQHEDLSHITNIAKGQTAKPDAGPAIGKMILKHLPSYEAENDELGYDPQAFTMAKAIANTYITQGERAGLEAQGSKIAGNLSVSDMIDELLSDAGASGLRTIWTLDEQGVAEATGDERFDSMMGQITGGAGARQGVDNLNKSLTARTGSDPETALAKFGQEFIKWLEDLCREFAKQGADRFNKLKKLSEFEDGGETMAHWLIDVAKQTKTSGITLADIQEFSSEFNTHGMWAWQMFPIAWSQNEWQDYKDQWTGPNGYIANLRHSPEQGVAEGSGEDPLDLSSDYALYIANAGRKMMTQLTNLSKKIQTDSAAAQNAKRWNLGDYMHQHYETDDLYAINQVFEEYGVGGFFDQNLYELLANWSSQGPEYVTTWKQYSGDVVKNSTRKPGAQSVHEQGVAEGFPQPGESSGKAKQFNPNAKVQTKEMTLDQILATVKGIPYVNNVVDDWDAKDYSWGVTKKVIEYAEYLQKNPQSVANLPPLVVIDGQLNDGAHRLSAINLLQKRMDPKNPLWKQVKLKVNFGTSADVAAEQGVAEGLEYADKLSGLVDLPVFNSSTNPNPSGVAKVVNTGDRIMVVMNVRGVNVPYYISTGQGGKASVPTGKWYPVFGVHSSGWLNKGGEDSINKFYGSKMLALNAGRLNNALGDLSSVEAQIPFMKKTGFAIINKDLQPMGHSEVSANPNAFKERVNSFLAKLGEGPYYTIDKPKEPGVAEGDENQYRRPSSIEAAKISQQTNAKLDPARSKFVWKRPNQIGGSFSEQDLVSKGFKKSQYNSWGGTQAMWNRLTTVGEQLDRPTPTAQQILDKHNLSVEDFIAQLRLGVKVELEHTKDAKIAYEIALDHLNERPDYYTVLARTGLEEAASGYIPTKAEKDDPRFKTALTVDVRPGTDKKNMRALRLIK